MTAAAETLTAHVIELISESGLEALSVRLVASRAGASIGAVQYHFPTKAAMLRAALRTVAERSADRYRQAVSGKDACGRLNGLLELLVPSGTHDVSARVWVAFAARAITDSEIREVYCDVWTRLHSVIASLIEDCDPGMRNPDRSATTMLALADGLTINVLDGSITTEESRSIITNALHQPNNGLDPR